ncbi:1,2-phenylacetyl-CoA epoxidase subunit PaaD [Stackebrandtia sp.]|jgi:ring-1,2-phenylacetyl-CoA epoxidase subunit PaaD|uniref:1,2-phenylacetyl-CoA epoxidase subunit PaaD n=1 Tax=Stackebrandtia sp. TaxID=2023065 RepID=UPI002D77EE63|nr:1,2-phenylacetyl-CoA epoxidase subunit PaaD [Stackebrandtia sp.]
MVTRAWEVAGSVPDPELPMLTIADLGILREAHAEGDRAVVTITPTYSGCPAMEAIRADVAKALSREGFGDVEIHTVYSPAWTTDWMSAEAKAKLSAARVAPPGAVPASRRLPLLSPDAPHCPRCSASDVEEISRFGPAACLSLWRCRSCAEPFEHFKAH